MQRTQPTHPDIVDKSTVCRTLTRRSELASVQHSFLDYGAYEVLLELLCQFLKALDLDPQQFILLLKLRCPLLHFLLLVLASHP